MSFLGLSLALALACLASIGGLLWAVYYRLANTPLKGRSLNKPDLPLELVDALSLVAVLLAFTFAFFTIGSLTMAARRWVQG